MDIADALKNCDLPKLIDRMTAYVYSRLKTVDVKHLEGKEPVDFVGQVLEKALTGTRNWNSDKCSLEYFLFGCLKSELYSFFRTKKYIRDEIMDIPCSSELEFEEEKKWYIEQLLKEGSEEDEILLFNAWLDGFFTAAHSSEVLKVDVKKIYQITKRLNRRLLKINLHLKPAI